MARTRMEATHVGAAGRGARRRGSRRRRMRRRGRRRPAARAAGAVLRAARAGVSAARPIRRRAPPRGSNLSTSRWSSTFGSELGRARKSSVRGRASSARLVHAGARSPGRGRSARCKTSILAGGNVSGQVQGASEPVLRADDDCSAPAALTIGRAGVGAGRAATTRGTLRGGAWPAPPGDVGGEHRRAIAANPVRGEQHGHE